MSHQGLSGSTIFIRKGSDDDELFQFGFSQSLVDATQEEAYKVCGEDLVNSALDGFNATLMAYGQTGSGKTFTMAGPPPSQAPLPDADHGIMPRAIAQMFSHLQRADFMQWSVSASYVEIYNETFRDLLEPTTKSSDITIFEDQGVVALTNVRRIKCNDAAAALEVLATGQSNRAVAGHALNSRSSRSHAIFTLWCETIHSDGQTFLSKLNMVDLAGSERSSKTGTVGAIAKEALFINKSLSFLEQVIMALSEKSTKHVPYRSSKLTHFLKDSIGGNCRTRLIACIWSDEAQLSETLSTCRFAQRMMQVAVNAHRNGGGISAVHGNLMKLDPALQQYLTGRKQQGPGLLQRMFSKSIKRSEHPSFVGFPKRASEEEGQKDAAPSIVILNSLTHDQLVDLLKMRGATAF
ncbi:hypothetical protein WJX75_003012 [Coccomyxa subellipsoidea]|uniref:Kinesin-like protein n=1 Tax=Coccomyxa subellipsoidea TaxID=248742 RepID=A0ABR2YJH5_9CHLO